MKKLLICAAFFALAVHSVLANTLINSLNSSDERPFITIWKTDNPGVSASNQIRIPGTGTDYLIEWQEVGNPGNSGKEAGSGIHTITFPSPGTYRVEISGDFTRINFGLANAQAGDRTKIIEIVQWGDIAWSSMENAFRNAVNMDITATDAPDLSGVTSMSLMFLSATFNRDLGFWDVSNVTNMTGLFRDAGSFNRDLSGWDVSNVTTMWQMFYGATSFNGDIGSWDVSGVNDMRSMFRDASSFNRDLNEWDVSAVTTMIELFFGATAFNGDISSWNVGNVTNMASMFQGAVTFNGDLSNWNVGKVTDMSRMFQGAAMFNGDIGKWDVGSVTDMTLMFRDARVFNSDLSNWNVGNVAAMGGMFLDAWEFNSDLSRWDVSKVTDMGSMFNGAVIFNSDISAWDVGNVTTMATMFFRALAFNIDIGGWNVGKVTSMRQMFRAAGSFNQDLSNWDMSSVSDALGMFERAQSFNGDLSGWNLINLTNTYAMFQGAEAFNGNISGWDLSNVTDMRFMFDEAVSFNQDVSGWDVSNVTMMTSMLDSTALSVQNYDALLAAWSELDLRQGVRLGAAGLRYCASTEERQALIEDSGWIITGDTQTESCFITEPELLVWPGDTNNDGIVTAADVLPIGLYFGLSGPARNQEYNPSWVGQIAELWAEPDATWTDATGDGKIDQNDLLPVGLNFGKSSQQMKTDLLQSELPSFQFYLEPGAAGQIRVLQLVIDADREADSEAGLLGFSAEVLYPGANIVLSEVRPGTAIDHEKLISFRKDLPGKQGTGFAFTRVRGSEPVTANGALAEFSFQFSETLAEPVKIMFRDFWISDNGNMTRVEPEIFAITVTSDEDATDPSIPAEFRLYQNYPNPFNPATVIQYSLATDSEIRIEVFNLMGQRVALLDHGFKPAGSYSVSFNASAVASGVYVYRLTTPQFTQTRRMVLIK